MTYSRAVAILSFVVVMLITALTPIGLPRPTGVDAGHDDPATSHLHENGPLTSGRIVRNVILGNAIPVCSDDLPISTKAAVDEWNRMLRRPVFKLREADGNVFEVFDSTDSECAARQADVGSGIGSVLVIRNLSKCGGTNACIDLNYNIEPNTEWDTYAGQLRIYVARYEVTDPLSGDDLLLKLADDHSRVTRSITHELGHVFGLGDYSSSYCKAERPTAPDVANYPTSPTVMGPAPRLGGTGGGGCFSSSPAAQDLSDYRDSYIPEAPTILTKPALSGSPSANAVRISWDAENVHVEKGFAVQRKTGPTGWETVKTHRALPLRTAILFVPLPMPLTGPQLAAETLTGQTAGWQTYRVVSVTSAPRQIALAASNELRIFVLAPPPPIVVCTAPGPVPNSGSGVPRETTSCTLSPPTVLSVSDVTGTGAMLEWNDATAATGYKIRRDGIANTTQTLGDVNSHPFTHLTARTAHVLEVASTHSSGDSRFASLTCSSLLRSAARLRPQAPSRSPGPTTPERPATM